jgi:hypothetical protein
MQGTGIDPVGLGATGASVNLQTGGFDDQVLHAACVQAPV